MRKRAPAIRKVLARGRDERSVHRVLKRFPDVVAYAFPPTGRCYLVSEFELGNEFRADFVAMAPFSGGWDVHFIELEPIRVNLFNKDGTPTIRFRKAVQQLDSWKLFSEKNKSYLLAQLSRAGKEKDLMSPAPHTQEPFCNAGWTITNPHSYVHFHYHMVIGRSKKLSPRDLELKASYRSYHSIDVVTYDRLLRVAEDLDRDRINAGFRGENSVTDYP